MQGICQAQGKIARYASLGELNMQGLGGLESAIFANGSENARLGRFRHGSPMSAKHQVPNNQLTYGTQ